VLPELATADGQACNFGKAERFAEQQPIRKQLTNGPTGKFDFGHNSHENGSPVGCQIRSAQIRQ
jgi:hypothetical protein